MPILLFVSLFALTGCIEPPKVPHHPMKGLWRESGPRNKYYLVVEPSDESERRRQPYTVYTNIEALLGTKDEWGKVSNDDGILGTFVLTGPVARLSIPTGEITLHREKRIGLRLWESYASYRDTLFLGGVLYPDGFFRLLVLFGLTAALFIMTASLTTERDKGKVTAGGIVLAVLTVILLFAGGYIVAGGKWLVFGYWDPFLAGRIVVYLTIITIVILLLLPLSAIREFKTQTSRRFHGSLKLFPFLAAGRNRRDRSCRRLKSAVRVV